MMRALAEFIMRGRAQAAMVAFLGNLVPLISPGAVALVSLRRGALDGTQTLFWALLPIIGVALLAQESSSTTQMLLYANICLLVVVYATALILRATTNWPATLAGMVGFSLLAGVTLPLAAPELSSTLLDELNRAQDSLTQSLEQGQGSDGPVGEADAPPVMEEVDSASLGGLIAFFVAYPALLCLVLGRWWQAMLYNPGGFGDEFRQLRLSQTQALIFFGLMALAIPQASYQIWAYLFALPLVVAGTAAVHYLIKAKGAGGHWLVFYYMLLLLFSPPSGLLVALGGLADSWLDFRRRYGGGPPAPKP